MRGVGAEQVGAAQRHGADGEGRRAVLTAGRGHLCGPAQIYPEPGRGLLSLSRSASEQGRRVTTRLLDLKRIECDKTLAKRFGQVLGYPLYKVARLRMVDGEPLMVETAFLPAERVEGLEKWDLERGSLFAVLEEAYGLIPEQGEEKVSITYATTDEAELMGIEEGAPLFWIVSQTYDQNGELLEYCRAAARPDRLRITSELKRRDAAERGGDIHEA